MQVLAPISVGELVDKITILKIKGQIISDPSKLANVERELQLLDQLYQDLGVKETIEELEQQLFKVNQELWHIEDFKRACEAEQNFEDSFVNAARQVYLKNDLRAQIKKQINLLTGSDIVEEKNHN